MYIKYTQNVQNEQKMCKIYKSVQKMYKNVEIVHKMSKKYTKCTKN